MLYEDLYAVADLMGSIANFYFFTLMVHGGTLCLHFFLMAVSPKNQSAGGPKFLDFSHIAMKTPPYKA